MLEIMTEVMWLLMLGITSFGVKFLHDMTKAVEILGKNVGRVVERIDTHELRLKEHEHRIKELENE